MLLAIDVGNTNTVFALYRDDELVGQWRLSTNRERTAEEYAAALIQLMRLKGYSHEQVGAVVISSVVPQAVIGLRWMSRDFFGCRAFVVGEDLDYPIKINLNNPREVGADRVVNALAARKRYSPPLIIVDFGTATTFDVVNDEGSYCGGAIAPGINLSLGGVAPGGGQAAADRGRAAGERDRHLDRLGHAVGRVLGLCRVDRGPGRPHPGRVRQADDGDRDRRAGAAVRQALPGAAAHRP